jgi:hypothetical protein
MFYSGSRIRIFSIPDPEPALKDLSILTQKNRFLSTHKYDPGNSSRIRIRIFTIPDPGVKKAPDPGTGTLDSTAAADVTFRNGEYGGKTT